MLGLLRRDKLDGHGHKLCIDPSDLRPQVQFRSGWIATLQLKDFNAPVQIENDEVAGCMTCFMPYERIHLGGSWSAIVQIVPRCRGPGEQCLS